MPNHPRADNPHRSVRVEDDLWNASQARAAERGETVSAVIRRALLAYVGRQEPCDGPLVWLDAGTAENGGVLECAARGCGYVVATGGFHDAAHSQTPVLKGGLA